MFSFSGEEVDNCDAKQSSPRGTDYKRRDENATWYTQPIRPHSKEEKHDHKHNECYCTKGTWNIKR